MRCLGCLIFFFLLTVKIHAQPMEIGAEVTSKSKEAYVYRPMTGIWFGSNWSLSKRQLTPNNGFFGDSLGERAKEGAIHVWSYSLGLNLDLTKHFSVQFGLGLLRNGEDYDYVATVGDSAFSYRTTYTFISLPIGVNYSLGNRLRYIVGVGVYPQLPSAYKQVVNWTTDINNSYSEVLKIQEQDIPNSFVMSVYGKFGMQLMGKEHWSYACFLEYRKQLNSTYGKTDGFIHKATNLGLTFSLIRNL